MEQIAQYSPNDKMASLISGDDTLLQVMSCFGISLGFGEDTVEDVCKAKGVDCNTFLAVVNFISDGFSHINADYKNLSILSLISYLRQAHIYFLDYLLPDIREKLEKAIASSKDKVAQLILKSFDEYMYEISKHMDYEDRTVFTYVEDMLEGRVSPKYKISTYSKHHDLVSDRLRELKNIIIMYTPSDVDNYFLTSALLDIYSCEKGLELHCKIEDYLFSPVVHNYEQKIASNEN